MSRAKYQRPEVHQWIGKSKQKYWKAEWHVYADGRPKSKHRKARWPCSDYTKGDAQQECDRASARGNQRPGETRWELNHSGVLGAELLPVRKQRVSPNTRIAYERNWTRYIKPAPGKLELQHVAKNAIEVMLGKMADAVPSDQFSF